MKKYVYDDIKDIDVFKEYIITQFPNINIDNEKHIEKLYEIFKNYDRKDMRGVFDKMSLYMKDLRNGKRSFVNSFDYWKSMGWTNDDEIKEKVSLIQKKNSKRCVEFYIKKGYTLEESKKLVSEYQKKTTNNRIKKYTKEDFSNWCVWGKTYWLNKGYSEEEAVLKVKERNNSCREHYKTDEEYLIYKKEFSKKKKELYESDPERFFKNKQGYISKEEISFFNILSEFNCDIKHLKLGINVKNTKIDDLFNKKYIICDGYLKINSNDIIIIEYDGMYWHNKEFDEIRDDIIFKIRKDVVGIIRINDIFVKHNDKEIIQKNIEYAIEEIKSKKCKRKLIYQS